MKILAVLSFVLCALLGRTAAHPTTLHTDTEVVKRAELIIVAHVKDGSIKRIAHYRPISDGVSARSYEHRATLIVSRVIKGKLESHELPITIHYGLLPVPAREEYAWMRNGFREKDEMPPYNNQEIIRIYEDNMGMGRRNSEDIRKDQIWLLRRYGTNGVQNDDTTELLGIWDPEDIQSLTKEHELSKHLRTN